MSADILWLFISKKYLKTKFSFLIFCFFLIIHPYSAIFYFKFTSIIFYKLCFVILFLKIHYLNENINYKNEIYFGLILLIFCLFRNSLIFLIAIYYLTLFMKYKNFIFIYLIILIIPSVYLTTGNYFDLIIQSKDKYAWSSTYIQNLFDIQNVYLSTIFSFLSKLFLLFGAREKLYVLGLEPFMQSIYTMIELSIYIFLSIFHILGIIIFFKSFIKNDNFEFIFFLIIPMLLPIFSVSHMRYFVPFIPLSLIGISIIIEKFF